MKRMKLNLLAMALVVPMLLVACSEDEPTPTPPGQGSENTDNPTPSPEPTIKPIIFETRGMYWQTEYDITTNTYQTLCSDCVGGNDIIYTYSKDADNPQTLSVTKFTIELGDEMKEVDISELVRQSAESPNGFFNVTLEGVTLRYEKQGEFIVSYDDDADQAISDAGEECQYYNISLVGDTDFSTELRVKDKLFGIAGLFPMNFDLTAIDYSTDRDYSEDGSRTGLNYYVYLSSEACKFPIISTHVKHFYITEISQKDEKGEYQNISLDLVEKTEAELGWFYVRENAECRFSHKENYKLDCEISANMTGVERYYKLTFSTDPEGGYIDPLVPTNFHIIQAAE